MNNTEKEMKEQLSGNSNRREEVIDALYDFVIRVSKGNATPEEVSVLPEVAEIIIPIGRL